MLELKDLYHLPAVEPLLAELATGGPGLVVVAGLDPRLPAGPILPSGRSAIFRILARNILGSTPLSHAIVVAASDDTLRLPRQFRHRVSLQVIERGAGKDAYLRAIELAVRRRPDLLAVDRLDAGTAAAALDAAGRGLRVLTQLDTVFRGAGVARQIAEMGVPAEQMAALRWIVTVHRLATLCPHCKQPALPTPEQLARLARRCPDLDPARALLQADEPDEGEILGYYAAAGCTHCDQSGRRGEMTAFDVFRADEPASQLPAQDSQLPLEAYLLGLAARGHIPLDDIIDLDEDQVRRTYQLLAASERALDETNAAMERKLAELEAANLVLQQRTQALFSMQGVAHALTTSTGLDDLAARLCRHACDLCGADRAIMYFVRPDGSSVEILAAIGWDPVPIRRPMEAGPVLAEAEAGPVPAYHRPPGVPSRVTDATRASLRAGLRVPLLAQGRMVGLMMVHTAQKAHFAPGEVALLQMFANQAALAVQRAGLVEALQDKIVQLEAAQVELVKKELMERELELARQVQQSVLPRIFPMLPGYRFGARSQAARQVGGDFYDVILLDADRVGIVVGDVSDKGLPAALYMALARSLLLAESRRAHSPREVLTSVHRLLLELGQPHMFVTVFYAVIDGASRRLTYCRAGHDRPLLIRGGRAQFLEGDGAMLGFPHMDDVYLSEEHLDLLPADRLVLYTDGLTDAQSPAGYNLGLERLAELIQAHADIPPGEFCTAILADVAAHQGEAEQYDDMTLLVVDVDAGHERA